MFSTIVLASDLSQASGCLIGCMNGLKALGAKKIYLTYALGVVHLDDMKYHLRAKVEPLLLEQKKLLEARGFETLVEIAPGIPSEEINRVAGEKDAALIVIGSHGVSMAEHVLFRYGGVASEVLHSFTRPLLLVRTSVVRKGAEICVKASCEDFLKNVLYCTDFSDMAQRAFGYVEKLVEGGCKSAAIMHVQDKTKIDRHLLHRLEEFNRIDMERIDMLRERLAKKGAKNVTVKIPYGIPAAEILGEADGGKYSLIVMGSQGRGYIREIFLGSVSHTIARNADASVLLIPSIR